MGSDCLHKQSVPLWYNIHAPPGTANGRDKKRTAETVPAGNSTHWPANQTTGSGATGCSQPRASISRARQLTGSPTTVLQEPLTASTSTAPCP